MQAMRASLVAPRDIPVWDPKPSFNNSWPIFEPSVVLTDKAKNRMKSKCTQGCSIVWRKYNIFVRNTVAERSSDDDIAYGHLWRIIVRPEWVTFVLAGGSFDPRPYCIGFIEPMVVQPPLIHQEPTPAWNNTSVIFEEGASSQRVQLAITNKVVRNEKCNIKFRFFVTRGGPPRPDAVSVSPQWADAAETSDVPPDPSGYAASAIRHAPYTPGKARAEVVLPQSILDAMHVPPPPFIPPRAAKPRGADNSVASLVATMATFGDVAMEPKLDGWRCIITKTQEGVVAVTSRSAGVRFMNGPVLQALRVVLENFPAGYLDAELTSTPGSSSAACASIFKMDGSRAYVHVFDFVTMDEMRRAIVTTQCVNMRWEERNARLRDFVRDAPPDGTGIVTLTHIKPIGIFTSRTTEMEIADHVRQCITDGHEGVVLKNVASAYAFRIYSAERMRLDQWTKIRPDSMGSLAVLVIVGLVLRISKAIVAAPTADGRLRFVGYITLTGTAASLITPTKMRVRMNDGCIDESIPSDMVPFRERRRRTGQGYIFLQARPRVIATYDYRSAPPLRFLRGSEFTRQPATEYDQLGGDPIVARAISLMNGTAAQPVVLHGMTQYDVEMEYPCVQASIPHAPTEDVEDVDGLSDSDNDNELGISAKRLRH